jgi:hypothetical protein
MGVCVSGVLEQRVCEDAPGGKRDDAMKGCDGVTWEDGRRLDDWTGRQAFKREEPGGLVQGGLAG